MLIAQLLGAVHILVFVQVTTTGKTTAIYSIASLLVLTDTNILTILTVNIPVTNVVINL